MQRIVENGKIVLYDNIQEKCVKHSSRQPDIEGDKTPEPKHLSGKGSP